MALFGKKRKEASTANADPSTPVDARRPMPPKQAFCQVCDAASKFSNCWLRVAHLNHCPCCKHPLPNVGMVYNQQQPACPRCGEYLEHPGFEYGLCDQCGSKFELMDGSKPGWLPNLEQRKAMAKHGKVWRKR
jgi:hypothetical protein